MLPVPCMPTTMLRDPDADRCRLERAMENPSDLDQQTIVENLNPQEAARLQRVRNIGIAVRRHSRRKL